VLMGGGGGERTTSYKNLNLKWASPRWRDLAGDFNFNSTEAAATSGVLDALLTEMEICGNRRFHQNYSPTVSGKGLPGSFIFIFWNGCKFAL
jgi:hypothetical protein